MLRAQNHLRIAWPAARAMTPFDLWRANILREKSSAGRWAARFDQLQLCALQRTRECAWKQRQEPLAGLPLRRRPFFLRRSRASHRCTGTEPAPTRRHPRPHSFHHRAL